MTDAELIRFLEDLSGMARTLHGYHSPLQHERQRRKLLKENKPLSYKRWGDDSMFRLRLLNLIPHDVLLRLADEIDVFVKTYKEQRAKEQQAIINEAYSEEKGIVLLH
ncbi:hypothetical protein SAMN02745218_03017 [Desulfofundulus australicus DSM 11792]|uniref:Uncharacterized protein n=1 Tax=Desulfofundulus australicus DSM 11792 TaxID=1121425 RepID=A0A1M5EAX9_9FIRM|nr:hypothetical protein [Desulfofundulus australicus]SHF76389.1 hypothetical protein SAMN02745218_03017 [Desulfofundulus australicus DSM 11792]